MNQEIKEKLLVDKSRLEEELKSYKAEDPYLASDRDMEVHSIAIYSSENEAHDRIEGVRGSLKESLSAVLLALQKIEDGTYGLCEKCGQPIEKERLEASPTAQFCRLHAH